MKKLTSSLLAAAALVLTGCASDEPVNNGNADGAVTFTIETPAALSTRAIADGTTANDLRVVIFTKNSSNEYEYVFTDTQKDIVFDANNKASVTVNLVKGETYKLAFWLDTELAYKIENGVLSMEYNNNNDDSRDAFYATTEVTVGAAYTPEVKLTRPFAQLNLGTNDFETVTNMGKVINQSSVKVDGVYDQMNLLTGDVVGSTVTAEFVKNELPDENLNVNGNDYKWLSMSYLLVAKGEDSTLVTISDGTLYNGDTQSINNKLGYTSVPTKRNHRTNIYGSLLTDATEWEIELDANFDLPDLPEPIKWDGSTATSVTPVSKKIGSVTYDLYEINTPAELAWVAENVDANNAYIKLNNDFDLDNIEFPGFGTNDRKATTGMFEGVFDGNGKTIKNLKVVCDSDDHGSGLIRTANNATVKNVTIESVTMTSDDFMGGVVGFCKGTTTISNCHVKNCNLNSADTAGGIVGKASYTANSTTTITGCTVSGTISGLKAGGIVGHTPYMDAVVKISECTNNATVNSTYIAAGICAMCGTPITITNTINNGNITSSQYCAGVIAYYSVTTANVSGSTTISECTNYGKITGTQWVRTIFAASSTTCSVTLTNNTNNGVYNAILKPGENSEYYCNSGDIEPTSTGYTDNTP